MINDIRIHLAIIMYVAGCISLILYNFVVIYRKYRNDKALAKNKNVWIQRIMKQLNHDVIVLSPAHTKQLKKQLTTAEHLNAFHQALLFIRESYGESTLKQYLKMLINFDVVAPIACSFRRRDNEEKAYFAHFIATYPELANKSDNRIITETLIAFTSNADIYCKVNVLKALCGLADKNGVVNVLQQMNAQSDYAHYKLLADTLNMYRANKFDFAQTLWAKHLEFSNNILLGIITFIDINSFNFDQSFLELLKRKSTHEKVRNILILYFGQHVYESALNTICDYAAQANNHQLAASAALALGIYSDVHAINTLNDALHSTNWQVRYNASQSLVKLDAHHRVLDNESHFKETDVLLMIRYLQNQIFNEKEGDEPS